MRHFISLPGCLGHTRDFTFQRKFPKTQAAQLELAVDSPGAAAKPAARLVTVFIL
jgi:hypothetical protein